MKHLGPFVSEYDQDLILKSLTAAQSTATGEKDTELFETRGGGGGGGMGV